MTNNRKSKKIHSFQYPVSLTTGANFGFVENITNLNTFVETLTGSDGAKVRLHSMRVTFRIYAEDNSSFNIYPIVVQTAGTFTSTVSISSRILDVMIDPTIDDVFGFDILRENISSKLEPGTIQGIQMTVNLSQKHLQILNKEQETERLQDLFLGFVGVCKANKTIAGIVQIDSLFTEERKQVIIR